ncbi:hypothetical protein SUGI_0603970 [Cryptomeria japonica]|nr:hypothetical protein SUGI_0603970 [Cryptomeria japonica]
MAASAAAFTACNKSSPSIISRTSFTRNFNHLYLTKKNSKLPHLTHATAARRRLSVNCRRADKDGDSSGEEPPESLFMKELKRRGMTPASLLEEDDKIPYGLGNKETKTREEGSDSFENRKDIGTVTGTNDWGQFNQRARSMALNSEGLEGLIPRAKYTYILDQPSYMLATNKWQLLPTLTHINFWRMKRD